MKLQTDNFIEDLTRWSKAYFDWMKAQDYSNNTIELYDRVVNNFIEYSKQYEDDMTIEDIRSQFFDGFMVYVDEKSKLKGKSINREGKYLSRSTKDTYTKAIKSFFSYITDNNDELYSFDRYLRRLKTRDKTKPEDKLKHLSDDEMARLHRVLSDRISKKDDYFSHRNSLLIKLMLHAGLRISEVLSVRLSDFSINEELKLVSLSIYAKGGKHQTAIISKVLIDEELSYFIDVAKIKPDNFIMITRNKTRLDRISASTIVKNIYKEAKINQTGLHILRHTFAMNLTKSGKPLVDIKGLLRHSSITTTTIYSKALKESLNEAMVSYGSDMQKYTKPLHKKEEL